jgi:hypothetical protein
LKTCSTSAETNRLLSPVPVAPRKPAHRPAGPRLPPLPKQGQLCDLALGHGVWNQPELAQMVSRIRSIARKLQAYSFFPVHQQAKATRGTKSQGTRGRGRETDG